MNKLAPGLARMVIAAAVVGAGDLQAVSLYQETRYQPLTADHKAHHRGDVITVMVYENSSGASTANTTAGREANVGFDVGSNGKNQPGSIKLNNQLDGRGQTRREGKVLAQITVTVNGLTENGDLVIAGEQFLEVNNERQKIKVEGRVRPQDISDVNTVLSTRIADAKISYLGEGDLADKQRPAWWQRWLTLFGL